MIYIDRTVDHLLNRFKGGQVFFTVMDKSMKHPLVVEKLLSLVSEKYSIIVSGGFGQYIKRYHYHKNILVLEGGLRFKGKINLESIADQIKHKKFIFIDDSYYSGKTKNVIKDALLKVKSELIDTYVAYDGSKFKDKEVKSLYRYHERH